MKKILYSNFELIENVIGDLKFNFSIDEVERLNQISDAWIEIVGNKFSQYTKVLEISADNKLNVACADSFIANELYLNKQNLLQNMCKKLKNQGIEIEIVDINFNYRRWNKKDV